MFIFFFSGIIPRVLSAIKVIYPSGPAHEKNSLQAYLHDFQIAPHFSDPQNASLAYLLFWFIVLYFIEK